MYTIRLIGVFRDQRHIGLSQFIFLMYALKSLQIVLAPTLQTEAKLGHRHHPKPDNPDGEDEFDDNRSCQKRPDDYPDKGQCGVG